MSTHEDFCDRLDSEFDNLLSDMKPYVLKHPNKSGKIQLNVCSLHYDHCLSKEMTALIDSYMHTLTDILRMHRHILVPLQYKYLVF